MIWIMPHRSIISASQATSRSGFDTWLTQRTGANTRGDPYSSTRATRGTSRCSRRTRCVSLRSAMKGWLDWTGSGLDHRRPTGDSEPRLLVILRFGFNCKGYTTRILTNEMRKVQEVSISKDAVVACYKANPFILVAILRETVRNIGPQFDDFGLLLWVTRNKMFVRRGLWSAGPITMRHSRHWSADIRTTLIFRSFFVFFPLSH